MARNNSLQIRRALRLFSAGYGRLADGTPKPGLPCDRVEEIDGSCGTSWGDPNFNNTDDAGSITSVYTWRDSNLFPGRNSISTRMNVSVTDNWTSSVDNMNNLIVVVTSTVNSIWRDDPRGRQPDYRTTALLDGSNFPSYQSSNHIVWGPVVTINGYYGSGATSWGAGQTRTQTFVIPPQQDSNLNPSFRVRNWNTNYANINSRPSGYIDDLGVGVIFRNDLPNQFDPPKLITIDQTPNICDSTVDAEFCFEHPNLNGANLVVQWRYEGQDWSTNRQSVTPAYRTDGQTCLLAQGLIPSSCTETTVYWRAQFQSTVSTLRPSEWAYGEFKSLFVPPVWMTVPDITAAECSAAAKGDLLDQYDKVVYYDGRKPACKKGDC